MCNASLHCTLWILNDCWGSRQFFPPTFPCTHPRVSKVSSRQISLQIGWQGLLITHSQDRDRILEENRFGIPGGIKPIFLFFSFSVVVRHFLGITVFWKSVVSLNNLPVCKCSRKRRHLFLKGNQNHNILLPILSPFLFLRLNWNTNLFGDLGWGHHKWLPPQSSISLPLDVLLAPIKTWFSKFCPWHNLSPKFDESHVAVGSLTDWKEPGSKAEISEGILYEFSNMSGVWLAAV